MSFREGRRRSPREYSSTRLEEKSHHARGNNPPSRHLWVGNIPYNMSESSLAHRFLRYGDLESIAFQPGRSYAFINYRNEEDAFAAMKELQGFGIGGNQLKIEFAKPEKSIPPSRDAYYSEKWGDLYSQSRESPFSRRDSRARHSTPEPLHPNKSNTDNRDSEPSEVLWVGFPSQMKMDEFVLRKAFSPFGEIEKITAFPGRTYGFVRFRSVPAATRAKEALHRKLFGNPRVHICFAKNESGLSSRERIPTDDPPSPSFRSHSLKESFKHFQHGRDFGYEDPGVRSPPYIPNLDARERMRNIYEPVGSPKRNTGVRIREQDIARQGEIFDDPWDLPEDVSFLHRPKKLKTESTFDNELPEYPLSSSLERSKHVPIPRRGADGKDYESIHVGHHRPTVPQRLMNSDQPAVEHWNLAHDEFQVGSAQLPLPPPMARVRLSPERRQASVKEVWKWEGIIAKGGNPVCRARCFPVGKLPDMVLPEYLDCTARTSLDMLAKNYYQAAAACAVFFAPADDPDILYYNEFMNYLGDRQRAAVVKLDDTTTLFLVPPSEFSEKVLKVPGRLSISGVILSLETPSSGYGPGPGPGPEIENREPSSYASFQGDLAHQKPLSPSGPAFYDRLQQPIHGNSSSGGDHGPRNRWPNQVFHSLNPSTIIIPRPPVHESTHGSYTSNNLSGSGYTPEGGNGKLPLPENAPSTPVTRRLPEQLLGQQQGQFSQSENSSSAKMSQHYEASKNEQVQSQVSQQQFQNLLHEDGGEADPQKRLQATLQLAAALLQQIQQGKGT